MPDPRDDLEGDRTDAPPGLFFSRRGNWFHDGQRVAHRRLSELLCRSVARDEHDRLIVTTGRDALPFVAEDAPLVVRSVVVSADAVRLLLSDGTTTDLQGPVVVGGDDRMRMPVFSRRMWASFSRTAQRALEPYFVDEKCLAFGNRNVVVVAAEADRGWDEVP